MKRVALDQINLRLPDGMRDRINQRAKANMRSMNNEVVMILANALRHEGQATAGERLQAAPAVAAHEPALSGGSAIQAPEMPR